MQDVKERAMPSIVDVEPRNERELAIARLIDASPEALYRCWTEPDLLVRWFAPKPLVTQVRQMDVRAGGAQSLTMVAPDGAEHPAGGIYLELAPGRRIVFTNAFQSAWLPATHDFQFVGEVTFEPQADGRTLYVARAGHWDLETAKKHAEMGFHEGWGLCAAQLAEVARSL